MSKYLVIIPTYNEIENIEKMLRKVMSLSKPFDVLVVDDGSSDNTREMVRALQEQRPGNRLHYYFQPNRKQGAARNLGVHGASGDLIVFLGDDVVPTPDLLSAHLEAHNPLKREKVVVGYTRWPPDFRVTRFMDYIGEEGWQFGYRLIKNPENLPFNFFYTSNLSLQRDFFLEAGGFDEGFREYGWEDIELSLRLKKMGMRLHFAPEAVGYHYHHMSIRDFVRRQHKVGYSAWHFFRLHPETADFLSLTDPLKPAGLMTKIKMGILRSLCQLTESWKSFNFSRYYPDLMSYYYLEGARQAAAEEAEGPR